MRFFDLLKLMLISFRIFLVGMLWIGFSLSCGAQSLREVISSSELGLGYAQIINLAATPDLSTASYKVNGSDSALKINVMRLPYEARWIELPRDAALFWRGAGGWIKLNNEYVVNLGPDQPGKIANEWTAYSLTGGFLAKIPLGGGFSLLPSVDFGVARLRDDADYFGAAQRLRPYVDGVLLNSGTDASLVTPGLGVEWNKVSTGCRINMRGHIARSWIKSFNESDSAFAFSETANVYSIRAEYVAPLHIQVLGRALDWLSYGGYSGFLGKGRDALGFSSVAELGLGVEARLWSDPRKTDRVRVGASYLIGQNVKGWSVSLGLKY